MSERYLRGEELRVFLVNNWMTHDAIWYGEVASRFGMAEASPVNLRVCRSHGKVEFNRFLKHKGEECVVTIRFRFEGKEGSVQ